MTNFWDKKPTPKHGKKRRPRPTSDEELRAYARAKLAEAEALWDRQEGSRRTHGVHLTLREAIEIVSDAARREALDGYVAQEIAPIVSSAEDILEAIAPVLAALNKVDAAAKRAITRQVTFVGKPLPTGVRRAVSRKASAQRQGRTGSSPDVTVDAQVDSVGPRLDHRPDEDSEEALGDSDFYAVPAAVETTRGHLATLSAQAVDAAEQEIDAVVSRWVHFWRDGIPSEEHTVAGAQRLLREAFRSPERSGRPLISDADLLVIAALLNDPKQLRLDGTVWKNRDSNATTYRSRLKASRSKFVPLEQTLRDRAQEAVRRLRAGLSEQALEALKAGAPDIAHSTDGGRLPEPEWMAPSGRKSERDRGP